MSNYLLKEANSYRKNKEFHTAVEYYESYLNAADNIEEVQAKVFTDYALCLRRTGNLKQSEKILHYAHKLKPENERIIRFLFTHYDFVHQLDKAKISATKLIELNPENAEYYFMLGKALPKEASSKSKEVFQKGLSLKHGISMEDIIQIIEKPIIDSD